MMDSPKNSKSDLKMLTVGLQIFCYCVVGLNIVWAIQDSKNAVAVAFGVFSFFWLIKEMFSEATKGVIKDYLFKEELKKPIREAVENALKDKFVQDEFENTIKATIKELDLNELSDELGGKLEAINTTLQKIQTHIQQT